MQTRCLPRRVGVVGEARSGSSESNGSGEDIEGEEMADANLLRQLATNAAAQEERRVNATMRADNLDAGAVERDRQAAARQEARDERQLTEDA